MNGDRVAMILDIGNDNKEDELEQFLAIEVGTNFMSITGSTLTSKV